MHPESLHSGKDRLFAQLLFDAEQLIVFADAVGTAGGASLDLARVERHRQVRDECVFRLPGTVGHDAGVAGLLSREDRFHRLRRVPDLIDLIRMELATFFLNALFRMSTFVTSPVGRR